MRNIFRELNPFNHATHSQAPSVKFESEARNLTDGVTSVFQFLLLPLSPRSEGLRVGL